MAKKKGRRADENDEIVGQNLQFWRTQAGLSQGAVGTALGVTFQQVQKYEKGTNRLSVGMIVKLVSFLNITLEDLFKGTSAGDEKTIDRENKSHLSSAAVKLAVAYDKIPTQAVKGTLYALVKSISNDPDLEMPEADSVYSVAAE